MSRKNLILRYVFFAVTATLINLSVQRIIFMERSGSSVFVLAIGVGTLAGLIVKYQLDKRWIFFDINDAVGSLGSKFPLYMFMGGISTVIFWATEALFFILWETEEMREVGAILGLSIGYVLKYQLDLRFVFNNKK